MREDGKETIKSETELEQEIFESLKVTTGLALAYFSAQNIDRFVTFFRASKSVPAEPLLLTCIWRKCLMARAREAYPVLAKEPNLRVFLPSTMKRRIVRERASIL